MWRYSMQTISQEQWIIQWNHRKICLNFHCRIPEPISMSLKILCMVTELPLLHLITESSPPKYISMLFIIKLAQIFSLDWFCWKRVFFLKWKYFSFVNFCCRISRISFTCFVKQDSKSPCAQLCGRLQTQSTGPGKWARKDSRHLLRCFFFSTRVCRIGEFWNSLLPDCLGNGILHIDFEKRGHVMTG